MLNGNEYEIILKNEITDKKIAKECVKWISAKAKVLYKVKESIFLLMLFIMVNIQLMQDLIALIL